MPVRRPFVVVLIAILALAAACGGTEGATETLEVDETAEAEGSPAGIRLISAADGAALQSAPPEDLVILDVRTPEEYADGHLEGAVLVDFYEADFADRIAELDPEVPYLLYCRSGNRSGQTAALMDELGFDDVSDVDGGIVAWSAGGHPTVTD